MTISRVLRTAVALALLATTSSCAQPGAAAPATPTSAPAVVPADPDAVVLHVGPLGGGSGDRLAAGLPVLVVYADGRVFTPAPVPAIAPGPALPGWNLQRIDRSGVQALIDQALSAGIAEAGGAWTRGELGLRFTLTTAAGTHVRDVRSSDGPPVGLTSLVAGFYEGGLPWASDAVAAVVEPWADLPDRPAQADAEWVGPALPGELRESGLGCVVATGTQARAVLDTAGTATTATPWVTRDGARWAVTFRPLLPHEEDCADHLG
jgi:hypothetical protein